MRLRLRLRTYNKQHGQQSRYARKNNKELKKEAFKEGFTEKFKGVVALMQEELYYQMPGGEEAVVLYVHCTSAGFPSDATSLIVTPSMGRVKHLDVSSSFAFVQLSTFPISAISWE